VHNFLWACALRDHNKANINIKHQTSTKGKVEVVIDADVSFRVKK